MLQPEDLRPADHFLFWEKLKKHWPVIALELHQGIGNVFDKQTSNAIRDLRELHILDESWEFDPAFKDAVDAIAEGRPLGGLEDNDLWAIVDRHWDWGPAYGRT